MSLAVSVIVGSLTSVRRVVDETRHRMKPRSSTCGHTSRPHVNNHGQRARNGGSTSEHDPQCGRRCARCRGSLRRRPWRSIGFSFGCPLRHYRTTNSSSSPLQTITCSASSSRTSTKSGRCTREPSCARRSRGFATPPQPRSKRFRSRTRATHNVRPSLRRPPS